GQTQRRGPCSVSIARECNKTRECGVLSARTVDEPLTTQPGKENISTTTETKVTIKALKNFRRMTPEVVLATSTNIHMGVFKNPNFTPPQTLAPPVDADTLKSANDALAAANAAAIDGGKKALAEQKRAKEAVVKLLMQLVPYIDMNCQDDMTIFLSIGLQAAATTRTKAESVCDKIRQLKSGPVSG